MYIERKIQILVAATRSFLTKTSLVPLRVRRALEIYKPQDHTQKEKKNVKAIGVK